MSLQDILVRFGGDTRGLDAAMNRVSAGATGLRNALGAIGIGVSAVAVADFARQSFRAAQDIDRMSKSLGLSATAYQELSYAFGTVQLQADDVADAIATLGDRAQDAMAGTTSMIEDFGLIGLGVDDLRGKDPEALFKAFADAVADTGDAQARTTAVIRTFGDDLGRRLLPLLVKGGEEFDRLGDEITTMSDEAVASAARIQAEWDKMIASITLGMQTAVVNVAAKLENFRLGIGYTLYADDESKLNALIQRRMELEKLLEEGRSRGFVGPGAEDSMMDDLAQVEARIRALQQSPPSITLPPINNTGTGGSAPTPNNSSAQRYYDQTRTAAEQYAATVAELQTLLSTGAFEGLGGETTFERALLQAQDAFYEASDGASTLETAIDRLANRADAFGETIAGAFEDAILRGGDLSSVLNNLGNDLARLVLRETVTAPLAGAISGAISNSIGSFSGGGISTGPSGGYLAALHGTEAVVPLPNGRSIPVDINGSAGAAPVSIVIENHGEPVSATRTQQSQGPNGEQQIRILVETEVKRMATDGRLDRTMASNYGLARRGVTR